MKHVKIAVLKYDAEYREDRETKLIVAIDDTAMTKALAEFARDQGVFDFDAMNADAMGDDENFDPKNDEAVADRLFESARNRWYVEDVERLPIHGA